MRTYVKLIISIILISIMVLASVTDAQARISRFKSARFQSRGHRYSLKIAQIIINRDSINALISKISLASMPKLTGKPSKPITNLASSNAKIMLVKQMLITNIPAIQGQIASQLDMNFSRMELRRLSSFLSFGVGKKFAQLIVTMAGDIVMNAVYQFQGTANPNGGGGNLQGIMGGGNGAIMRSLAPAIIKLLQNSKTQPQSRSKFNQPFKGVTPIK